MADGVVGNIKEWIKETEQARGDISAVLNLVNIENFKQTDNFYVQYYEKIGTVSGTISSTVNVLTGYCRCDNASAVSYSRCKQIFDSYGIHSYYTLPYDGSSKEFNLPFSNYDYRLTTNSSNLSSMTYSPNNFRGVDGTSSFSVSNMTDGYNGLTKKGNAPYNVAFLKSDNWLGCAFFQLGVHNDTNFIDCSYYFVELNEDLVSALGSSNIIERYDPNDPNFGMGGVAQGLTGIIDTLTSDVNVPLKSNKGVTGTGFVNIYEISQNGLVNFGKDMFSDIDINFNGMTSDEWLAIMQDSETKLSQIPEEKRPEASQWLADTFGSSYGISDLFKLGKQVAKNFFNSMLIKYVLSVHVIPVSPVTSASAERINVGFKTFNQTAKRVTDDYIDFDCGTLTIPSKYKNFLDFTQTKAKIYLPFIGMVDISPQYFYDCTIGLKYRFSVIDGTCVAFLTSTKMSGSTSLIGTYNGSCCMHIPFTGENYSSMISGVLQGVGGVASGVATANPMLSIGGAMQGASSIAHGIGGTLLGSPQTSSSASFMGIRTPYIIIERPIPQLPPRYFDDHGALANIVEKPINCKGYTRCSDVNLPTTVKSDIAIKLKEIMESGFIV